MGRKHKRNGPRGSSSSGVCSSSASCASSSCAKTGSTLLAVASTLSHSHGSTTVVGELITARRGAGLITPVKNTYNTDHAEDDVEPIAMMKQKEGDATASEHGHAQFLLAGDVSLSSKDLDGSSGFTEVRRSLLSVFGKKGQEQKKELETSMKEKLEKKSKASQDVVEALYSNPGLSAEKKRKILKRMSENYETWGPAVDAYTSVKEQLVKVLGDERGAADLPTSREAFFNRFLSSSTPWYLEPENLFLMQGRPNFATLAKPEAAPSRQGGDLAHNMKAALRDFLALDTSKIGKLNDGLALQRSDVVLGLLNNNNKSLTVNTATEILRHLVYDVFQRLIVPQAREFNLDLKGFFQNQPPFVLRRTVDPRNEHLMKYIVEALGTSNSDKAVVAQAKRLFENVNEKLAKNLRETAIQLTETELKRRGRDGLKTVENTRMTMTPQKIYTILEAIVKLVQMGVDLSTAKGQLHIRDDQDLAPSQVDGIDASLLEEMAFVVPHATENLAKVLGNEIANGKELVSQVLLLGHGKSPDLHNRLRALKGLVSFSASVGKKTATAQQVRTILASTAQLAIALSNYYDFSQVQNLVEAVLTNKNLKETDQKVAKIEGVASFFKSKGTLDPLKAKLSSVFPDLKKGLSEMAANQNVSEEIEKACN
ncbi:unnamed protein product [Amoebophrya sp. A25]|nr:unnamed protein product [Amoebophrya sp. A25]|eukprot:GSA25T00007363001.1